MLDLEPAVSVVVGSMFIAYVTIQTGGVYLTRVAAGAIPLTEFQKSFHRAGHGHAGMFVTIGIVAAVLSQATDYDGVALWVSRVGIGVAALVMSGGFFAAAGAPGRDRPSRWIWLLWLGAAIFAASAITLGVGLIRAA